MAQPYIGEILQLAFNWAPEDYALCNGEELQISQNQALFSLITITFGGNGSTTMRLPDLRGRAPVHPGAYGIYQQGQFGGYETVTLGATNTGHSHDLQGIDEDGNKGLPINFQTEDAHALANVGPNAGGNTFDVYGPAVNTTQIATDAVSSAGGGQSHNNLQPSTVINFVIAMDGLYPSRN